MKMRSIQAISMIAALFLFTACVARAEVVDRIVVVVNTEVITQGEIDRVLEPVYEQYRSTYYGNELIKRLETARKRVIDQLIDDRLILSEAKKLNVEVPDKDIETRLQETRKRFPSDEAFEEKLNQENLSINDLKKRFKEQIMVRKLIDQKVGSRISISPVEVNDYYFKHISDFMEPEEVKLRNILIRHRKGDDDIKAKELADEVLVRLKAGGDFGGLARQYSEGPNASEGGLMGYVKRGDLLPPIEEVVFNLQEGALTDVIATPLGYHIFKVEEKKDSKTLSLSETRREVEDAIYREKAGSRIKGWIETLKKNAYISFK